MKIGILHLTDAHIKSSSDWIIDKYSNIVSAVKDIYEDCDKIYMVFTGDIAFSGSEEEYQIAYKFLNSIRSLIKTLYGDKLFLKIIITPGNHDCNFKKDKQTRKNAISNMSYDYIGDDNSVIEECLSIQTSFWKFYQMINNEVECTNSIYDAITDQINGKDIVFHCFNTAWMSSLTETVGTLFYPVEKVKKQVNKFGDLNISIFHHHYSWLNPNTTDNNKNEFSQCIREFSDMIIYGHEHEQQGVKVQNIYSQKEQYDFSGEALQMQKGKKIDSGFQSFIIDFDTRIGYNTNYHWNDNLYYPEKNGSFILRELQQKHNEFQNRKDFICELNNFKLPLFLSDEKKIRLKDIFIYPDLEKNNDLKRELYDDYIDSSSIINDNSYNIIILEGENQSGKTSLLNMLYLNCIEQHKYPLLINGKCLKKTDIDNNISSAYKEQYEDNKNIEEFKQTDNSNKILLIDNLNQSELNNSSIIDLLNKLRRRFGKILITTSSIYNIVSILESDISDILSVKILPLGHKKRNKLIERYHILNEESPYSIDEQIFLERTKASYEQVQTFLGDKLIPSYPIFILSMLQSMNLAKPNSYEQTSYGYCYQSLIHFALAGKAKVKNEDIDTFLNYLAELAYAMFKNNVNVMSESDWLSFYKKYANDYISPALSDIKDKLLKSGIIIEDDSFYKFGYNYIYYFLVARKIADMLSEEDGKNDIKYLCEHLHKDKYANILIFVAHHSKDPFLIDEAILSSMIPFDNIHPITLELNGSYYNLIKDIIEEFKDDIIRSSTNPMEEREKRLTKKDQIDKELKIKNGSGEDNSSDDDRYMPAEVISFHQAVRSLEIVGQIIKNRKGSIPKEKLFEMTKELYLTAFRTIGFLGEIVRSTKDELINSIQSKTDQNEGKTAIAQRVNLFFQLMSFNFCLGIFSKVINAVGNKELRPIFDDVANSIGTPAAKLVSFSIKTCYGKLSIKELKDLVQEFEKNPVALRILKARVKSYLYNNYIEFRDRQKIVDTLKMSLLPPKPNLQNKTKMPN